MKQHDRVSQPAPGNEWTLCAARPDDNNDIVRLVCADPCGDGVKLLGTTERAIRFGALVASSWPGASWSAQPSSKHTALSSPCSKTAPAIGELDVQVLVLTGRRC